MNYQHVLVAIDNTDSAFQVLQHAIDVAHAFKSKLTVIQVLKLDPITSREYLQTGETNFFIERARKEIVDRLAKIQQEQHLQKVDLEIVQLEGFSIAETITKAANDLNADLMVIGSHGYTGLSKLILGSISQKVLNKTPLPVLIVH